MLKSSKKMAANGFLRTFLSPLLCICDITYLYVYELDIDTALCVLRNDVGYEEKTVGLIRRIDFAWAVEREDPSKKQKKSSADSSSSTKETSANQPWPWQSLVENLRLAHQELSVIIDLIQTVTSVSHLFYSCECAFRC